MLVTLVSTYDLGHQPFGLASPARWLRAAGHEVCALDVSRQPLDEAAVARAGLVAFYLPMHTATRLAAAVIERVRAINPQARLAAYGVYAPPNEDWLRGLGVADVIGPECEPALVWLASAPGSAGPREPRAAAGLPRLQFLVPDRAGLPPLSHYAGLRLPDGERRVAGYTEATRGCRHRCRHCPIVPVYDGQFRVVQADVVLADIGAQVDAGARHVTFGDPDFLNGPTHAVRIVERLARECPGVTYDVTIKVEHLLRHERELQILRDTGCLFVTSAIESFDDAVLARLEKGHTRIDIERAVQRMRRIGVPLVPTFVAFTPWTTRGSYGEMLDAIESLDLVEHVAPIQLGIRLLVPRGSRLLELADMRVHVDGFSESALVHTWRHPDPSMDRLQREVMAVVGRAAHASRQAVFRTVRALAASREVDAVPAVREMPPLVARAAVPYLDEPWYC